MDLSIASGTTIIARRTSGGAESARNASAVAIAFGRSSRDRPTRRSSSWSPPHPERELKMAASAATLAKAPNCAGPREPATIANTTTCSARRTAMAEVMMLMLPTSGERSLSRSCRRPMRLRPGCQSGGEQPRQMRQVLHGEPPVAADQARELQIAVVDDELEALADQPLHQLDERALTQIVGVGLEGQPEDRHPAAAVARDHADDAIDLMLIGGERGVEHEALHVEGLGVVAQRAKVLGQAGAAERKAGPEIGGRDVELAVGAEDGHDGAAVDAAGLADLADLVGEAHLQGVPAVVRVFDRLGGAHVDHVDLDSIAVVEPPQGLAGPLVDGADHGDRGGAEILDCAALAQELRMIGEAEIDARLLPRDLPQHRDHIPLHGTRQDRAADDEHVTIRLESHRAGNVLASLKHVAKIEISVVKARGADAHEAQLRAEDRLVRRRGRFQPPGSDGALDQHRHVGLADRGLAGIDGPDLLRRDVHRDDAVALVGHASSQHGADVSDAEDADSHQAAPALKKSR